MRYVCPRCKGISNSKVETRNDKPMEFPECTSTGYWGLAYFQMQISRYEFDHWNRTVICKHCGSAHHFFKNE